MDTSLRQRLLSLPNGVAHRGLHDLLRPENSKAAFEAAVAKDQIFECDMHLTKDGRLLVCHDSDLLRMTGKPGIIEELTLAEIQEGYTLPDGSTPPTLEEVFAINHKHLPMVLELKCRNGNEEEVARHAVPLINALPQAKECFIISFWEKALFAARKHQPIPPLGYLVSTEAVRNASKALLYEFDFLDVEVHYSMLPRFARYRKDGGALMCWTVKDRLTHFLGKLRCDALTWEIVDSSRPLEKENAFIRGLYVHD